ncbi:MAG: hypothetical protein L0Z07_04735 [Planctomycetes bacterium]|nr:hypothetical protein [Planctomycetota bacterium]
MVLEKEVLPYLTWLMGGSGTELGTLYRFLIIAAMLAVLALLIGFLTALLRYGPLKAGDLTYRVLVNGFSELAQVSPRRVWALARLAVKESIRRRVVVVLVVFAMILLFASWFLQTGYRDPGKLFFSFVLTATTYLVLFISLLISALSLPQDFKSKTIHTVMTKPVRAGEIVLGRILGFTIVGTVLLAIMAIGSYLFVVRTLYHTHAVEVANLESINDADGNVIGKKGHTTSSQSHRHEIEVDAEGNGVALSANGHDHEITAGQHGGEMAYEVGGPRGLMRARMPHYGKLRFLDRKGVDVARGISVGSEWTYRSFIEGGTSAAAIWTFDGIDDSTLRRADDGDGQYLPLELIVRVFRSYTGNIDRGIQGSVQLRNPDKPDIKTDLETFTAKDDSINDINLSRKLYDPQQKPIDLLEDLVSEDGRLDVIVQCLDRSQYFGFAQADAYLRKPDGSPWVNFVKAFLSIWVQMLLVIAIGVTCSTVVNGPVAVMFTVAFIALGFFKEFFVNVATGKQVGGGPLESLVRLVTQKNQTTGLDEDNLSVQLMHAVDKFFETAMRSLAYVLPDFRSLSTVDYVAYGFNIPPSKVYQDLTVGLAYLAGLLVIGYFLLRTREVAK